MYTDKYKISGKLTADKFLINSEEKAEQHIEDQVHYHLAEEIKKKTNVVNITKKLEEKARKGSMMYEHEVQTLKDHNKKGVNVYTAELYVFTQSELRDFVADIKEEQKNKQYLRGRI